MARKLLNALVILVFVLVCVVSIGLMLQLPMVIVDVHPIYGEF